MEQTQSAQQRLKHASAPPNYGRAFSFLMVHGREGYPASVQMKMVIFTLFFCSSAECSSSAATAPRRRKLRLKDAIAQMQSPKPFSGCVFIAPFLGNILPKYTR
jgi:hypothetical protein